ncbi:hypothetical protein FRC04_009154 [Tulasnella sp. 424]|nr:hypothetical protein FRC04_009154 [Tulasnella sp. 424]KAG8973422.1 hypothetical protein FRC05_008813 [Tulasnella sp. 425]
MSDSQDQAEEALSLIDFGSLGFPFNTTGGYGDIYKAPHPQWGFLALKRPRGMGEPDSPSYRHLLKEADLWKAARHPNVLQFLGAWEANNTVYLVSPFLDNGTIMQYLVKHPNVDRTKFILDIARGLSYLHDHNIVHGDIKGNNILITPDVDAVLADFGLAKVAETSTASSQKGTGSSRWQSPEILRGGAHVHRTFSSDVYSFGMTIYEILSGTIPFKGENTYGVIGLVTSKKRPEMKPKLGPSGLRYCMQWRAARCAWNDDPQLRPNMQTILRWLESEGFVRGRISVSCERKPRFSGYISPGDSFVRGCVVVAGDISKATTFNCASKGTFPQSVGTFLHPGYVPRNPLWNRHAPVEVSEPAYMSKELNEIVKKARERGDAITPSSSIAEICMTSHDGELSSRRASNPLGFEDKLHPAVLTTVYPAPLVFCTDLAPMDDLPNVSMIFEEIDSDTLF